jgi:imidazole glycerol-phosphate synthase subunit HisH
MIVIIDYGMGNVGSIANMLKKIGVPVVISSNTDEILRAKKLILPGVGAFDNGMRNLSDRNMIPVLQRKVIEERTPLLGICLGMQLFTSKSEEGKLPGLGWINGETRRFDFPQGSGLKIPHMGWNTIRAEKSSPLLCRCEVEQRFYFVHSFHVACNNREDVLTTTPYGGDFVSAVARENIYGVQFHPEKSHRFGMELMKNFVELA